MVRLCMRDLVPCWLKLLNLSSGGKKSTAGDDERKMKLASSGSHWKKIKTAVKSYLDDLLSVMNSRKNAPLKKISLIHIIIYKANKRHD